MIKLSKLTDYAVVILSTMAQEQGTKMSAVVLSEKTGLSEPTVAKILKKLAKESVVKSIRGANGGYVLPAEAQEISIVNVIAAMDGPLSIAACVDDRDGCCDIEEKCPVKGKWTPVNAAIYQALEGVTLADMMPERG